MTASRQPFLLGIIGAVIGIVLAVLVFGGFGGGNASASASPTSVALASGAASPSIAPSAAGSGAPTVPPLTAPPTTLPTASAAAGPTTKPSPTANTNPTIVSFETPKQEDCTNSTAGSVHVKWTIKNATGVTISIDGPGVYDDYSGLSREVDLPFGCSDVILQHTYTITTVGGTGPAATITRTIKTRPPSIVSFSVTKPDCAGGTSPVGITIKYEIRAATGAELYRDGSIWSTYNGKIVTAPVMYDCTQNDQAFKLVTTGGYGPAATRTIKVSKN